MLLANNLRLRPDLVIQPQDAMRGTWVVKDPVSLRFFLFGADEHFILQRLQGDHTAEEILDDFARERAPRRLTMPRLHDFLAGLCRNGLATSDAPAQTAMLRERQHQQQRRESLATWTNLLAIRLPGFNPDGWLDRLYPLVRPCFAWWFWASSLLLWIVAGGVAIAEFDALASQWPRAESLVQGRNLAWLAVALAGVKVIHELAHAFTCKHFGGRCHELGLMLLVFTPCLYCNVTDAWMLRSRWRRIAISAAGILTELQLAAVALLVWRFTQPGLVNSLALNVIVVCSLGTLLFNGNPLLKYDGYYVLSDLVRVPNLWQESRSFLFGWLNHWLLGRPAPDANQHSGRQTLHAIYAVASLVYRCCLTVVIFLFLYRLLLPLGLELGLLLVAASIAGQTAIAWSTPVARWWRDPLKTQRMNKLPTGVLLGGAALLIAAVLFLPLPCRVTAPALLEPRDAQRVYVATPGTVVTAIAPGEEVVAGQALVRLVNTELEDERLRIDGDRRRTEARVRALETRQADETGAAAQLLVAEEILADLDEQARLKRAEADALELTAPAAGVVISPPATHASTDANQELPTWDGAPLDARNRGCHLERGTLVCLVGDPKRCDAVCYVDETDVRYLDVNQAARLRLAHLPATVLSGQVIEIAEINADTTPAELALANDLATRPRDAAPLRTLYRVRIGLDASTAPLLVGARGAAKIEVEPQTIGQRVVRWLRRTLTLETATNA